jgi:hypothetical protein
MKTVFKDGERAHSAENEAWSASKNELRGDPQMEPQGFSWLRKGRARRRYRPVRLVTAIVTSFAVAAVYCRAALRDERLGFPCTAAMEWRTAAELFPPQGLLAECCWREWERIMCLPRRCAVPLDESSPANNAAVVEITDGRRLSRAVRLGHHRRMAA